jgi:cation transport ATPase
MPHDNHDRHGPASTPSGRPQPRTDRAPHGPGTAAPGADHEARSGPAGDHAGHGIAPIFGTAVFVYGGRVFLQGAVQELRQRLPGMMTLIALAITVAFLYSAAVTLGFPGHALWWELSTLVTIMLLGHWIEMRSIFQAQGALKELASCCRHGRCLVDGRPDGGGAGRRAARRATSS